MAVWGGCSRRLDIYTNMLINLNRSRYSFIFYRKQQQCHLSVCHNHMDGWANAHSNSTAWETCTSVKRSLTFARHHKWFNKIALNPWKRAFIYTTELKQLLNPLLWTFFRHLNTYNCTHMKIDTQQSTDNIRMANGVHLNFVERKQWRNRIWSAKYMKRRD